MRVFQSMMLLMLFALAGEAQAVAAEETSSAVIPVIGSVIGIGGVHWRTDVELSNPSGGELTVALTLPTAGDGAFLLFTLASGQTIVLNDIVHEAFGLEETMAPLLVTTGGRRSVSVTCTIRGKGPLGEVLPQSVRAVYGEVMPSRSSSGGIAVNQTFRTNVGLANLDETPTRLTLALQRLNGRNVATTNITLPPLSFRQVPLQTLFPLLTKGSDLIVLVESSGSKAYAYTSVLRNDTHDGVFSGP